MYCNCLLMTHTRELGPILGNLDPYSGTLNLTRTRLCTKVPKYNTLKKALIFCIFFDKCLKSYLYTNHWCLASLSCLMGHRIWIWAQKDWFYLEILGQEVGPISMTRTVSLLLTDSSLGDFFFSKWRIKRTCFLFISKSQATPWILFVFACHVWPDPIMSTSTK